MQRVLLHHDISNGFRPTDANILRIPRVNTYLIVSGSQNKGLPDRFHSVHN